MGIFMEFAPFAYSHRVRSAEPFLGFFRQPQSAAVAAFCLEMGTPSGAAHGDRVQIRFPLRQADQEILR